VASEQSPREKEVRNALSHSDQRLADNEIAAASIVADMGQPWFVEVDDEGDDDDYGTLRTSTASSAASPAVKVVTSSITSLTDETGTDAHDMGPRMFVCGGRVVPVGCDSMHFSRDVNDFSDVPAVHVPEDDSSDSDGEFSRPCSNVISQY
jgi:hypothetical protein